MLCKYVERCICLKPSLQCSNLLAVDKIEIGVTSTLLRRTEMEILGLFWENLGPFFWFSVQYRRLVKRELVKIKPIIFRVLDCLGWKTPLITGIFTFFSRNLYPPQEGLNCQNISKYPLFVLQMSVKSGEKITTFHMINFCCNDD